MLRPRFGMGGYFSLILSLPLLNVRGWSVVALLHGGRDILHSTERESSEKNRWLHIERLGPSSSQPPKV